MANQVAVTACFIVSFDDTENGPDRQSIRAGLHKMGYEVVVDSVNQDFDQVRQGLKQLHPNKIAAPSLFLLLIYAYGSAEAPNKIFGSKTNPKKCLDLIDDILKNIGRVDQLKGKWIKLPLYVVDDGNSMTKKIEWFIAHPSGPKVCWLVV